MRALSVSAPVLPLFAGTLRPGVAAGRHHLDFGGFVVGLTAPGGPRMPNGVEAAVEARAGDRCWIGEGRLRIGGRTVLPGPAWDPVARAMVRLQLDRRIDVDVERLAGRGAGLTPSGDDLLCGYVAGLVLWHGRREEAERIAGAAAGRTTALSATLLLLAAGARLPEPAHAFLRNGDPGPLHRFGHSSGRALLVGLALAC